MIRSRIIKSEIDNYGKNTINKRIPCEDDEDIPVILGVMKRFSFQVYDYFDKYTFFCEMYDVQRDEMLNLVLHFYPFDNSVQVTDPKRGKNLLKRCHIPTLTKDMLQMGNIVNIFSNLLLITDCAPTTRSNLFGNEESTFALIKPTSPSKHGKIITFILKKGFRITRMKNASISTDFARSLFRSISDNSYVPIAINYVTTGEVIGLELVAPNAVKKWRECLGATESKEAAPGTLRHLYGEDRLRNVAHGCDNLKDATELLEYFFGMENGAPRFPFKATYKDCTLCIIKPHAITDGNAGSIIESIATDGRFYISAMAMFSIKTNNAEEFYEVYKGVFSEYKDMCGHLTEGKCIALEVKCVDANKNSVCEFRKLCGPHDPDVCRQLYPESIRAQYGKTRLHNAVHCTDLPEDGSDEVEYFFKLLANE